MPTLFFDLPFPSPAFAWAFWTVYVLWAGTEAVLVVPHLPSLFARQDRGSLALLLATIVPAIALAFLLAFLRIGRVDAAWLQWLGLALMAVGIAWRLYVVIFLGRFFTPMIRVRSDQHVITGGPFRLVRHPSYLGMLVTMAGFGLALGCWPSLAVMLLVPAPALIYRMSVEEHALLSAFGDEYRRYAARTRRLIPLVW